VDTATLQRQQSLYIRQQFTLMVNRYEVRAVNGDGSPGEMIAFAQQKRMALKEQVSLYTDESKTNVLVSFKARKVLDLASTYDVTDGAGRPIGLFRKDFAQSLLRSTWHLEQAGGPSGTGQERSFLVALLRRFTDISFLPYHFDFVAAGRPMFSVVKHWGLRDKYLVTIQDPALDRRLVAAMAVGLDALQSR
jgi:uncharacterized protein YxjI